jgi:hypothetical protein
LIMAQGDSSLIGSFISRRPVAETFIRIAKTHIHLQAQHELTTRQLDDTADKFLRHFMQIVVPYVQNAALGGELDSILLLVQPAVKLARDEVISCFKGQLAPKDLAAHRKSET